MRRKTIISAALVIGLLLAGAVLAEGPPVIGWSAITGGGGSATAGSTTIESVIGQWAASGAGQLSSGLLGGARGGPNAVTVSALAARPGSLAGLALISLGCAGLAWAGRAARRRRSSASNH